MPSKYLPQDFEQKWIDYWEKEKIYSTRASKGQGKMYVLAMFPYPSGEGLHVGHTRIYTGTDVIARYFRMQGKYSVLHPMGWDAFGLPAENVAIKAKKNPMDIVPQNIANFKRQMKMLGLSYDWNREFSTTDSSYYKWTQWLFIQFFKMGLLYKKLTPVFYCEFCKTGLAEEEVLPDGTHERCGNKITKRDLPQWIFRITAYADKLLEDLNGLDWPSGILEMQKNWIGKSEGVELEFRIKNSKLRIKVFTTALDTIYGTTFMVLAPEHKLVTQITTSEQKQTVQAYIEDAKRKTDLERQALDKTKSGVFTGAYCINPLNNEEIPVWIADYVLMSYGTGAVMGVPGHDARDHEFAKKYSLAIKPVIKPLRTKGVKVANNGFWNYEEIKTKFANKSILFNSGKFDRLSSEEAKKKLEEYLEEKGFGKKIVNYHLRDWIFSRQRYWGEPIPMIYCEKCAKDKVSWWDTKQGKIYQNTIKIDQIKANLYGWFPLDEKELPLELPYLKSYEPAETGQSPLSKVKDWVETGCPNCQSKARRETDTMPNWAGSCWYFLRFADPDNNKEAWSEAPLKKWLPVDWYIGGAEHAVLHLLYSRFWIKALYDMGLVRFKEPFQRLRNVGLVLGPDGFKMSKSRGNVVNPDDTVSEFGADATRLYEMFMAPFAQEIAWSTQSLQGAYRFLKRIWQTYHDPDRVTNSQETGSRKVIAKLQSTIAKVSGDITNVKFNTAVAAMMEFLNEWEKGSLSVEDAKKFLKILAPFAPFITEEIWKTVFKEKNSIHLSNWPKISEERIEEQELRIPIQVNGKLRAVLIVPTNQLKQEAIVKKALQNEKVKAHIEGKKYKAIYRKGKILNFVTL